MASTQSLRRKASNVRALFVTAAILTGLLVLTYLSPPTATSDEVLRGPVGHPGPPSLPDADGPFTFTVTDFRCGLPTVGRTPTVEHAGGRFCLLTVRVENTGIAARSFFAENQFVLDATGNKYGPAIEATAINDPNGDSVFSIDPHAALPRTIVFDVPLDTVVTAAELHTSASSSGVHVRLEG